MRHTSQTLFHSLLAASVTLLVASPAAAQIDQFEKSEITQPNGQQGETFGHAVSFDGATLAAGAALHDVGTVDDGEVYLWQWTSSGLGGLTTLQSPSGSNGWQFGSALAVDGDTLVVGERLTSSVAFRGGAAHVFVRQSGAWTHQATLALASAASNDLLGTSVDADGDRIVIGAPRRGGAGAVFVYERSAGIWTQTVQLVASDAASGDLFGESVALHGDTVLVGAPVHGGGGVDQGAAYVFRVAGGNWTEEQKLEPSMGTSSGGFGSAVDLAADLALVGATRTNDPGAAYAFARAGSLWSLEALLTAWSGNSNEMFGSSVALSGERAVIGSPQNTVAAFLEGSAYVFQRDGGAWTGETRLVNPIVGPHGLGNSAAFLGDTVFVGAQEAVYEFELLPSIGANYCTAQPNSTGQPGAMYAHGSVLAAENRLRLHAAGLPDNSFGYFITGHGTGEVFPVAGSSGRLCLGGAPIGRYVNHVLGTGRFGWFSVVVDLTQTPTPTGLVAAQAGETWNFQAWHRDAVGGQATSNFTDAISVTLQ